MLWTPMNWRWGEFSTIVLNWILQVLLLVLWQCSFLSSLSYSFLQLYSSSILGYYLVLNLRSGNPSKAVISLVVVVAENLTGSKQESIRQFTLNNLTLNENEVGTKFQESASLLFRSSVRKVTTLNRLTLSDERRRIFRGIQSIENIWCWDQSC